MAVYNTGDDELFRQYTYYNGIGLAQHGMRPAEMDDIDILMADMHACGACGEDFDNWFVGYSIPQIGKEFDLLRFGADSVIDLEIKRTGTLQKIERQLRRNSYYISFLKHKRKLLFCYVCASKKIYRWNGDGIEECSLDILIEAIDRQGYCEIPDIDSLFNPADYLVSPFNSTAEFVQRRYFLTKQQEEIKDKIMKAIDKGRTRYHAVTGKPGTGKTLLVYDMVNDLIDRGRKVLIIHCAKLNQGQLELINDHNWDIIRAKDHTTRRLTEYDVIVVDEAQRIYPNQLKAILDSIKKSSTACIFSFDAQQCLSNREISYDNAGHIVQLCGDNVHTLTEKIRTNHEVAEFLSCLLDRNRHPSLKHYPNISISYCDNDRDAKSRLAMLRDRGWTVPVYTPSQFNSFRYESYCIRSQSAHEVIGQEFDDIVVVIDSDFLYDDNGILCTNVTYDDRIYSKAKMFYQIISRTRRRLHILFINNRPVFHYCLSLLYS